MVEARRVELLSENQSARLSTSVAVLLTFPQSTHFWRKNGFRVVRELPQDEGIIQVAERLLTE